MSHLPRLSRALPAAPRHGSRRHSSGFTLVELLVVISVLAILVALLIPAVNGVRVRARVAQVKSEIKAIETALIAFQQDHGILPPSRFELAEDGANWPANSRKLLTTMWPQFDFTVDHDFNCNGSIDAGVIELHGSECLVFFLGGLPTWIDSDANGLKNETTDVLQLSGFSRNPADPFAPLAAGASANRQGPYYNFDSVRLFTSPVNANFRAYVDAFPAQKSPYLYASAYDGRGYEVADFGGALADFYRNGDQTTSPAWNQKTFQLISPGSDGAYGTGGPYTGPKAKTLLSGGRAVEQDNITNFSDGVLAP